MENVDLSESAKTRTTTDKELQEMAEAVKELFQVKLKEFSPNDFVKVANLLGFHAHMKFDCENLLKPVAENYFTDIIGTNLQYAVEAYVWETHMPMTDDGHIVSGFFDTSKAVLPEGYVMDEKKRVLALRR